MRRRQRIPSFRPALVLAALTTAALLGALVTALVADGLVGGVDSSGGGLSADRITDSRLERNPAQGETVAEAFPSSSELDTATSAGAAPPVESDATRHTTAGSTNVTVALVIDDFGNAWQDSAVQGILRLPCRLTVGVLPGRWASERVAELAHARGHDVIVHLPMEPEAGSPHPSRDALPADLPADRVAAWLDSVTMAPHAVGLSNHQGSRATRRADLMRAVAAWCGEKGWYVFDSLTHPRSALFEQARRSGVRTLRRDRFLDHHPGEDDVRNALRSALERARGLDRPLVLVGHPQDETWRVLRDEIPALLEDGVRFVTLSDVLAMGS